MKADSSFSKDFAYLGHYCSQIKARSHQTLYFDSPPAKFLAQRTFQQLTTKHYIEHIGPTTWRFSECGADELSANIGRDDNEIPKLLLGFLVGLFNDQPVGKSLKFQINPLSASTWQSILYECVLSLVRETHWILEGEPSKPHNKDFGFAVTYIKTLIDLRIQTEDDENGFRSICFEHVRHRRHDMDTALLVPLFGVILATAI